MAATRAIEDIISGENPFEKKNSHPHQVESHHSLTHIKTDQHLHGSNCTNSFHLTQSHSS